MEEWRAVIGIPNYEVSDQGRVRSLDRRVPSKAGSTALKKGKVRRPNYGADGQSYAHLNFWMNGKFLTQSVHVLVLEAFVGPRPLGLMGLHRDDDHTNNTLVNLYWGDEADNAEDARRNGKLEIKNRKNRTIQKEEYAEIVRLRKEIGPTVIAKMYGVSRYTIHNIIKGSDNALDK